MPPPQMLVLNMEPEVTQFVSSTKKYIFGLLKTSNFLSATVFQNPYTYGIVRTVWKPLFTAIPAGTGRAE